MNFVSVKTSGKKRLKVNIPFDKAFVNYPTTKVVGLIAPCETPFASNDKKKAKGIL